MANITEKQIEIIKTIKSIVSGWSNTNDINSPTHVGDLYGELNLLKIDDILTENQVMVIGDRLEDLLGDLQDIK